LPTTVGRSIRKWTHVASGAVFTSNITLWREAGYFDVGAERKPLLHLWSLGVEEQFYLVWPALLGELGSACQQASKPPTPSSQTRVTGR